MGIRCAKTQTFEALSKQAPSCFIYKNMIKINKGVSPQQSYQFIEKIGKGSYSQVYKAKNKLTGKICAIKQIDKKKSSRVQKMLLNEFAMLRALDHPNIMKMYEYFEEPQSIYIAAELCPGNQFFQYIIKCKIIPEEEAKDIFYDICSAVRYMHSKNIMHRDLKPENILFDPVSRSLKIVDLGSALEFQNSDMAQRKRVGTSYYIAPQVLVRYYNEKCDIWSLGVILYIMLSGQPPFRGKGDTQILQNVKIGELQFKKVIWKCISEQAKKLISLMLQRNIKKRLIAKEILEHSWLKSVLQKKLKINTEKHISSMTSCLLNMNQFSHTQGQTLQDGLFTFIVNFVKNSQQQAKLQQCFKNLDLDGNGVLSKEQLIQGLMRYLKTTKKIATSMTQAIFKRIDSDLSNCIDYSQFVRAASKLQLTLTNDNLQLAFNYLDRDRSGKISAKQLQNQLGTQLPQKYFQKILKIYDKDKDGQISKQQFVMMMNAIKLGQSSCQK